MSLGAAFKAFFTALSGKELIDQSVLDTAVKSAETGKQKEIKKLKEEIEKVKSESSRDRFSEGATYTLVLMQREGRLVDFLMENIDAYSNEQIGTAVRNIHKGSAKVLSENFNIKPLVNSSENSAIEVSDGFDPYAYKLSGTVPEKGPYKGTLTHKGWTVSKTNFPKRSDAVNPNIVHPTEVQL